LKLDRQYLFEIIPIESGLKQGDALSPLLFSFTLQYAIRKAQARMQGQQN
jgi:hypothetical protein